MECVDTPHFVISIWIHAWIWIGSMDLHGHSTLHNIHIDTNMDMDTEYGSTDMDMDTEYGSNPHFTISIWIQMGIWIWSMDLHGHSTLCNIHMDTNMDIDMEYGSTWSVETLYISKYPYGH